MKHWEPSIQILSRVYLKTVHMISIGMCSLSSRTCEKLKIEATESVLWLAIQLVKGEQKRLIEFELRYCSMFHIGILQRINSIFLWNTWATKLNILKILPIFYLYLMLGKRIKSLERKQWWWLFVNTLQTKEGIIH